MKKHCVYLHTFPNGKKYIGQAIGKPERRWGKMGNGYITQQILWDAIQKYGWNNIQHEIIKANLTQEEANNIEKEYIQKLNTIVPHGYNIKFGGKDGVSNTTNIVVQKLNNTIVNIFFNIEEASEKLNMHRSTMKRFCESGEEISGYSFERFFNFPVDVFYKMEFVNNSEHCDIYKFIWTENEDSVIIENYHEKGAEWCAKTLNRSKSAVQRRASAIGVANKKTKYTIEEENFLMENYKKFGCNYCAEVLGRSQSSINQKAHDMHLNHNNYYTIEEEYFLKENHLKLSKEELAKIMNRSERSIVSKIVSMGLRKRKDNSDIDNWLVENYSKLGGLKCAEILNLTKDQIAYRVKVLGLKVENCTHGKSKYKYVQWNEKSQKWRVVIGNIGGKKKQFGLYDDEDEAGKVAMERAREYGKF